jgi:hypothetical protein
MLPACLCACCLLCAAVCWPGLQFSAVAFPSFRHARRRCRSGCQADRCSHPLQQPVVRGAMGRRRCRSVPLRPNQLAIALRRVRCARQTAVCPFTRDCTLIMSFVLLCACVAGVVYAGSHAGTLQKRADAEKAGTSDGTCATHAGTLVRWSADAHRSTVQRSWWSSALVLCVLCAFRSARAHSTHVVHH